MSVDTEQNKHFMKVGLNKVKKYRVFGTAVVTICIDVSAPNELTEEEIYRLAKKRFRGIHSYAGNGGDDKLVGVEGESERIFADEPPVFDDFAEV